MKRNSRIEQVHVLHDKSMMSIIHKENKFAPILIYTDKLSNKKFFKTINIC